MIHYVKKHPDAYTLSTSIEAVDQSVPPEGYEPMTSEALAEWEANELANGWTPAVVPIQKTDEEIYAEHLALGYLDPVTGIKLKTVETAQTKFTSQFTLLSGALQVQAVFPNTPTQVWDFADQPHTLTVEQVLGLLLRYGFHCQTLFANYGP